MSRPNAFEEEVALVENGLCLDEGGEDAILNDLIPIGDIINGGAIDIAIKGYVADSTGKAGIRGRLVSKQGTVLANALLAGVASGIGNAFTQSSMVTSTSPLGSTQTVQAGKELQAGLGQGAGTALNQLSRYYISLAEKLFPIIEVDAGQPVDIVITKGFSVARKN